MASIYSAYAPDGSRLRIDYSYNTNSVTMDAYIENATASFDYLVVNMYADGSSTSRTKGSPLSIATIYVGSWTKTISHNNSYNIQAQYRTKYEDGSYNYNIWTNSVTIPRYPQFVQQYVANKTINSVNIRWQPDTPCGAQYSLNDGAWTDLPQWTEWGSNFDIIGLNANTYYNVRVKIRRIDNGLETISNYLEFTTYDIARVVSCNNFNDEQDPYMTFSNPSGANLKVSLELTNPFQTVATRDNIQNTGNYTFELTQAEKDIIYARCSSSSSTTIRYVIVTKINSADSYWHWLDRTITVINANPLFNNFTYQDVNATTIALTGSNQKIVKGFSNVKATISVANKAVALKGAIITKYTFKIGSKQIDGAYSNSANVDITLNAVDNSTLEVYAIDSRGNSTKKEILASTFLDYFSINVLVGTVARGTGGIGTAVTLNFDGNIWNNNFGSVTNSIVSATYKYKKTTDTTYATGSTVITPTLSGDTYSKSVSIAGDLGASGFDNTYSYNIQVIITDKLSTAIYNIVLQSGKPQLAFGVGKGMSAGAFYNETEGGSFQIEGKKGLNTNNIIDNLNSISKVDALSANAGNEIRKKSNRLIADYTVATAAASITISALDLSGDGGIYDVEIIARGSASVVAFGLKVNNITTGYYAAVSRSWGEATASGQINTQSYFWNNRAIFDFAEISSASYTQCIMTISKSPDGIKFVSSNNYVANGIQYMGTYSCNLYSTSDNLTSLTFSVGSGQIAAGTRIRIWKRSQLT